MHEITPIAEEIPEPVVAPPSNGANVGRGIAIAAGLISLGNVGSSVLGQVRNSVIAHLFGRSDAYNAYVIASAVPNTLYDFLVGGLVSAALVPVFSELAARDEQELSRVASTVFTTIMLLVTLAVAAIMLLAPPLGTLLTSGAGNGLAVRPLVPVLVRWMAPALIFMALTGLLTGLSQARHRFGLPALAISLFNIGMIVSALLLHRQLDTRSLAVGMLVGALAQVALLVPTLRGLRLRPRLELGHPEVRRLLRLYAPVVIGISFSILGTVVDRHLASGVPQQGAAAVMAYATTLIQFGMGVITSAIALAALPTLSRQGVDPDDLTAYRRTLALSLKSVLLLILPAAVGLAVLARPIIQVVFQGGAFQSGDTGITSLALLIYVPSMVAAAIDQPLIFAFYARKNTLLPNIVQGIAIAAYLVVALATVGRLGMFGLILGNVAQWTVHAVVMLWFAHRRLGALRHQRLGEALLKGLLAAGGMGLAVAGVVALTGGAAVTKAGALGQLVGAAVVGMVCYGLLARLLRIETFESLLGGLTARLARRKA